MGAGGDGGVDRRMGDGDGDGDGEGRGGREASRMVMGTRLGFGDSRSELPIPLSKIKWAAAGYLRMDVYIYMGYGTVEVPIAPWCGALARSDYRLDSLARGTDGRPPALWAGLGWAGLGGRAT